MFRKSTFLAIALSATAIGVAIDPAAALSSQLLGGARLSGQFHPGPSSVQPSQQVSHIEPTKSLPPKIQVAGSPATSPATAQIPMPKYPSGMSSTIKPSELGKLAAQQLPPPVYKPGNGIDNVCPFNKFKCPPTGSNGGSGGGSSGSNSSGGGPVVILAPQVPIQVPVQVPIAVPVPVRVATAVSTAVAAPARPSVTPQCAAGNIPALAAGIDELLPDAQLSKDDITKVTELRQMIQDLSTDGKLAAARNIEEAAMYYLGYQKVWLRCGAGTFDWEQVASNDAGTSK